MALKLDSRFRGNDKITSLVGLLLIVFTAILIFIPSPASAGLLPACTATGACQVCDIVNVFVTLGKWLIISAGGLALLVITWASFGFVTSAGNPEKITGAKKQITGAILGVGITLAAFQLISIIIATLAVPSANQGFAGQTSEETGKFASLSDFLGIPWWSICNVKELRKNKDSKQNDITYKGTGVCRYWGDGTPCQDISEDREKKLIECGYLEGSADLTPEEKEKQEKECKAAQEGILRCCKGECTDKECITEKIVQPIAQSSQAYKGSATMLATPGPLQVAAKWQGLIKSASNQYGLNPCVLTAIVVKESSGDPQAIGYDVNRVSGEELNVNGTDNFLGLVGLRADPNRAQCKQGCSRGIGLAQLTIFPDTSAWIDRNTPARPEGRSKYNIRQLLDPQTNLNLAAAYFKSNMNALQGPKSTGLFASGAGALGVTLRQSLSDDARLSYAFAAYNGGLGGAQKIIDNVYFSREDGVMAYMQKTMEYYGACINNGV